VRKREKEKRKRERKKERRGGKRRGLLGEHMASKSSKQEKGFKTGPAGTKQSLSLTITQPTKVDPQNIYKQLIAKKIRDSPNCTAFA